MRVRAPGSCTLVEDCVCYRPGVVRRFATALSALLVCALVAGCGEDPEAKYQRELREVGVQVAASLEQMPTDREQPIEPAEIARLATRLRAAAEALHGVDAPENARAPQRRFERGLRGVASALEELARDLEDAGDDEAAQAERFVEFATNQRIERSFDDLAEAQDEFARAGFRVFEDPVAQLRPAR